MLTMSGVFLAGTATVTASGIATLSPGFSTQPFKNLGITVVPYEKATHYRVSVYFAGELEEQHTYPSGSSTVAHMLFPNMIFPPNSNTANIPQFFTPDRVDPGGVGVSIVIESFESDERTFQVFVCFEEFDNCRFGTLHTES